MTGKRFAFMGFLPRWPLQCSKKLCTTWVCRFPFIITFCSYFSVKEIDSMHGAAQATLENWSLINQINPITHDKVNVKMIVIEIGEQFYKFLQRSSAAPFRMSNGDLLQTIKVGDPTGCINLTIRHPDAIEMFQPGDILRLRNGYVNIHRVRICFIFSFNFCFCQGSVNIQANRQSEIHRIGEFCLAYSEIPNMSDYKSEYAALERQKKGSPPDEGEVLHPCLLLQTYF